MVTRFLGCMVTKLHECIKKPFCISDSVYGSTLSLATLLRYGIIGTSLTS